MEDTNRSYMSFSVPGDAARPDACLPAGRPQGQETANTPFREVSEKSSKPVTFDPWDSNFSPLASMRRPERTPEAELLKSGAEGIPAVADARLLDVGDGDGVQLQVLGQRESGALHAVHPGDLIEDPVQFREAQGEGVLDAARPRQGRTHNRGRPARRGCARCP